MKIKIIILTFLVLSTSCSQDEKTEQKVTLTEGTYFQSYGNKYLIELIGFENDFRNKILQELDNRIYKITKEGAIVPTQNENEGHSFFIDKDQAEFKYFIQVKNISSLPDKFIVNIQVFINEIGQRRRVFNPGVFDITKIAENKDTENRILILKNLIITLTYK